MSFTENIIFREEEFYETLEYNIKVYFNDKRLEVTETKGKQEWIKAPFNEIIEKIKQLENIDVKLEGIYGCLMKQNKLNEALEFGNIKLNFHKQIEESLFDYKDYFPNYMKDNTKHWDDIKDDDVRSLYNYMKSMSNEKLEDKILDKKFTINHMKFFFKYIFLGQNVSGNKSELVERMCGCLVNRKEMNEGFLYHSVY